MLPLWAIKLIFLSYTYSASSAKRWTSGIYTIYTNACAQVHTPQKHKHRQIQCLDGMHTHTHTLVLSYLRGTYINNSNSLAFSQCYILLKWKIYSSSTFTLLDMCVLWQSIMIIIFYWYTHLPQLASPVTSSSLSEFLHFPEWILMALREGERICFFHMSHMSW